ncbi:uncharacterized protein LOC128551913 [Mercenaria mercenaria]|uniref:uncharacterized protein LOC128551913 n=1 Tax=Mercenaria mercenaria TaxID=6596 RepID=UPI00234F9C86|nr:uncharacterized protein LOC128551913 [Mercenaria mercenaria]
MLHIIQYFSVWRVHGTHNTVFLCLESTCISLFGGYMVHIIQHSSLWRGHGTHIIQPSSVWRIHGVEICMQTYIVRGL